jgi:hypothetical protein
MISPSSIIERELARFGHTSTQIGLGRILIFGGAIDNNENKFVTTNDTFVVNVETLQWTKLESEFIRRWQCAFATGSSFNLSNRQ